MQFFRYTACQTDQERIGKMNNIGLMIMSEPIDQAFKFPGLAAMFSAQHGKGHSFQTGGTGRPGFFGSKSQHRFRIEQSFQPVRHTPQPG